MRHYTSAVDRVEARPHVVHVITRLDRGGATANVLAGCIHAPPERYRFTILHGRTLEPDTEAMDRAVRAGVTLIEIPAMVREVRPWHDLRAWRDVGHALRRLRPDIVHTHSSKAGLLGRMAAPRSVPVVHTPHGHIFHGYFPAWQTRLFLAAERRAAKRCRIIIGLTELETRQHLELGIGHPAQFRTVHSGVDVARFAAAAPVLPPGIDLPAGAPLIVGMGRLVDVKDFATLLEAFAHTAQAHPTARLVIAGDGPLRDSLTQQVASHPARARIYLLPWVDAPEGLLACGDLFALTSKNEGLGRVLIEAMAAGAAVVATDVGGVAEVLAHGEAGVLAPRGADLPARFGEAMTALLREPERRATLIQRGRARALGYDITAMVRGLDEIYQSLLDGGG